MTQKKAYTSPVLTTLGAVADLTRNNQGTMSGDSNTMMVTA